MNTAGYDNNENIRRPLKEALEEGGVQRMTLPQVVEYLHLVSEWGEEGSDAR